MYELIEELRPYFFSLREVKQNVSLDIRIPTTWKLEHVDQVISQYRSMNYQVQDKTDRYILISLVSEATQDGYNTARICALEIINYNKELEEKEKLFKEMQKQLQDEYQKKIRELQDQFKSEPLEKLKDVILKEDGQKSTTGVDMVREPDEEGPKGA